VRRYGEQFRTPRRERRPRPVKTLPCSEWSAGPGCW
jgi:hypothetical protein